MLHSVITSNSIHVPCGVHNLQCPCMKGHGQDRHCCNNFPKSFRNCSILGENSFPKYGWRTPNSGGCTHTIKRESNQEQTVGNRWVVPYTPFLLVRYQAHINVEMVYSMDAVKYLYKYICKGSDMVIFTVQNSSGQEVTVEDAVETFVNTKYISASEAH